MCNEAEEAFDLAGLKIARQREAAESRLKGEEKEADSFSPSGTPNQYSHLFILPCRSATEM